MLITKSKEHFDTKNEDTYNMKETIGNQILTRMQWETT